MTTTQQRWGPTRRRSSWRTAYRGMSEAALREMEAAFVADRADAVAPSGTVRTATIKFCDQRLAFIRAELARRSGGGH